MKKNSPFYILLLNYQNLNKQFIIQTNSAAKILIQHYKMGQAQSPPKYSARPTSNMFHNNLAQKIKDSAFKKHISTHAFVRKSNLRDIKGSKISKSSGSQKSQNKKQSKIKQAKQAMGNKKAQKLSNHHINQKQNNNNFHLSDIQQSEAQYQDDEIKKYMKTQGNQLIASNQLNKLQNSTKSHKLIQKSNQSRQQSPLVLEIFTPKIVFPSQQAINSKIQTSQSNLYLFTQSKNVSSHKSGSQFSKSQKEIKHSYVEYKTDFGDIDNGRHQPITSRQNEGFNRNLYKKHSLSRQNQLLQMQIEQKKQIQSSQNQNNSLKQQSKTKINPQIKNSKQKQSQMTIKFNDLAKTTRDKNNKYQPFNNEQLFYSNRKVYASQLNSSKISSPQSPQQYQEHNYQHHQQTNNLNKLINSKSFQSDIQKLKSSIYKRKSQKHRQKLRQSISLKNVMRQSLLSQSNSERRYRDKLNQSGDGNLINSKLISKQRHPLVRSYSEKSKNNSMIKQKIQDKDKNMILLQKAQRKTIKEQDTYEIQNNFKNTQQSYFNYQNQNVEQILNNQNHHSRKSKKQILLKNQIQNQSMKLSQYQVKSIKQSKVKQIKNRSQQQVTQRVIQLNKNENKSKNKNKNKNNSKIKDNHNSNNKVKQNSRTKKIYVFSEQMTYNFQQNSLEKTRNVTKMVDQDRNCSNIKDQKQQKKSPSLYKTQYSKQKASYQKSKNKDSSLEKKIRLKVNQQVHQQKAINHRIQKKQQTIKIKQNINKKPTQNKNQLQSINKNNRHLPPSDIRNTKLIKFSQLQHDPFQKSIQQKMIQTTSSKFYSSKDPLNNHKQPQLNTKPSLHSNNLVNLNPRQLKHKSPHRINNQQYQTFIQQLSKLKRIKQIQNNLLQQNIQQLRKSSSTSNSKKSITSLNKQLINQEITLRIQRMNKLQQLSKLTKKIDPLLLGKSKSSKLLGQVDNKYNKHNSKHDIHEQKTLEEQLYFNFSKQMNNFSHLKQSNYNITKRDSKLHIRKGNNLLLNSSSEQYMITHYQEKQFKTSNNNILTTTMKQSKQSRNIQKQINLTSIPQSPEMIHQINRHNRDNQKRNLIRNKTSQIQKYKQSNMQSNNNSLVKNRMFHTKHHHSMTNLRDSKFNYNGHTNLTNSLQKNIQKRQLIVF